MTPSFLCLLLLVHPVWYAEAGSIVAEGGGGGSDYIWAKIVELAGGAPSARIGVVSAASSTPEESADYYVNMFKEQFNVLESYWVPVYLDNKDANSDPEVIDNITRMTGFFFSGGDQSRIMESFYNDGQESPALQAIKARFNNDNAVISGSSAGAAILGTGVLIQGGMSYEALLHGAYEYGTGERDYLVYDPHGIEVMDDYIFDTHYSDRGREGRLTRLVWDTRNFDNGVNYGIGVDTSTAIAITNANTPSAEGEVLGRGGVMIVDISQATDISGANFGLDNVFMHYLTHGDKITMSNRDITIADWKSDLAGNEMYDQAETSKDIFDGTRSSNFPEFQKVARSLFDARLDLITSGETKENNPGFEVEFEQLGISRGYGGWSPVTGGWEISYESLKCKMFSP